MMVSKNRSGRLRVTQEQDSISIESGRLSLKFGIKNKVSFDEFSLNKKRNWLCGFGDVGMFWRIHFTAPQGTSPVYSNNEADFEKAFISKDEKDEKEITFLWGLRTTQKVHSKVEIRIKCERGKSLSYWYLKVSLPRGWKVKRADFPHLSNIAVMKKMKVLVPGGWGNEYDFKPCFKYEGNYPSWSAGMQMVAFYDEKGKYGLYFASHDPKANLKDFHIDAKGNSAELWQCHIPSIPENDADFFALDYAVVLGVFKGGYYEAGQIYREFALTAKWADEKKKTPVPAWLKETELWLRPDGAPEKNLEATREALEFFGVKTALHWYRWHQIPYDTHYPEYLPALPGIPEAVKELQDQGSHAAFYINGRLCDPESETWYSEMAFEYASLSETGECYSEIYGSKIPNNVMCPYTEYWQDKIAGIARSLEEECGIHGVYIDQVAAGRGVPCYNPNHGHPVGGGDFWRAGYELLLDKTRNNISDNTILITEENAECWLNLFDAHLMVNTQVNGRVVPLFQSVYSGKTILICSLYYSSDEPKNSLSFRMKTAITFLWGSQLGWIQPFRIMDPEVRTEADFLKNLAKTRQYAHSLIDAGRFLGMLNVEGDNPLLKGVMKGPFSGQYDIREPAVSASAWLSPEGKLGILITNISDESHEVKLDIPFEKAGRKVKGNFTILYYNNSGLVERKKHPEKRIRLLIPERSAMVLEVDF
jgi:hypothetical protein